MPSGIPTTGALAPPKKSPIQLLPEGVIRTLRAARNAAYVALNPLDYLGRLISGKADFPPLSLRRYVGAARTFESSGAEFLAYLRLLSGLRPDENVLDVGCGCGLMALYLRDYLDLSARYVGLDIYKPAVCWCQRHIGGRHKNFTFIHANIHNQAYNPHGRESAAQYEFPFEDGSFDVILLKSVFTHLRPVETTRYLQEIARLLSPGGRCLATFFLLNERQAKLAALGRSTLNLAFGEGAYRYVHKECPESAIAYDEGFVLDELREHELRLARPIAYGNWSGFQEGLSYQDILILERVP